MSDIQTYQNYLCYLCRQSACLEQLTRQVEAGMRISAEDLSKRLMHVEKAKKKLLEIKEALGMEGGLDFMDDVNCQGFSFKQGRLEGDYTNLEKVILPWITHFNEENPYLYEVGVLLAFHYGKQMGYGEEEVLEKKSLLFLFKKLWKKVLVFLSDWCGDISTQYLEMEE